MKLSKEKRLVCYKLALSYFIYPKESMVREGYITFLCNLLTQIAQNKYKEDVMPTEFVELMRRKPKYDIVNGFSSWFQAPEYKQTTIDQNMYRRKILEKIIKKMMHEAK